MLEDSLGELKLPKSKSMSQIRKDFSTYFEEAKFFLPIMEKHLDDTEPKSVAEIGSGLGLLAMILSRKVEKLVAFEPSSAGFEAVRKAHKILDKQLEHNVIFKEDQFELKRGGYDLIYSINVVEHVPEWRELVENALESLEKGGNLILIFPNYTIPYEPHFNIPILFTKAITRRLLTKKILNSSLDSPEEFWKDLSFPKYKQIHKLLEARSGIEYSFSKNATLAYVDRLGNDAEFTERKSGLFFVLLNFMKKTGILRGLLNTFPKSFTPIIHLVVTKV